MVFRGISRIGGVRGRTLSVRLCDEVQGWLCVLGGGG